MSETFNNDIASYNIRLNELKSQLDKSFREGDTIAGLKQIHYAIKQTEAGLKALAYEADAANGGDHLPLDQGYR